MWLAFPALDVLALIDVVALDSSGAGEPTLLARVVELKQRDKTEPSEAEQYVVT